MSTTDDKTGLSYRDAGVDIDVGNELVKRIKGVALASKRAEVLGGLGGFGAMFELPRGFQEPILVAATDGVGTKLKLAIELECHNTIGVDLVAMCVNDLIVQGAEPLFFLDYYATGHLELATAEAVIAGIGIGCQQAGCSLIGGETAEMPGLYDREDYDLAGFCVGIVEKSKIIDGQLVKPGDVILGLASSGIHSNGYSLVRRILELNKTDLHAPFEDSTFGDELLKPTRIYVKPLLNLFKQVPVHALAHITGGGLTENVPRVLPNYTKAVLETDVAQIPAIFKWIQASGKVSWAEMFRTFNCGTGMAIVVPKESRDMAVKLLCDAGETVTQLGSIVQQDDQSPTVEFLGMPD